MSFFPHIADPELFEAMIRLDASSLGFTIRTDETNKAHLFDNHQDEPLNKQWSSVCVKVLASYTHQGWQPDAALCERCLDWRILDRFRNGEF